MFSVKHCIILACTIALVVAFLLFTKGWDLKKKSRAFMVLGLLSETVKIFFYIVKNEAEMGGLLPKTDLPFQLCSIQILFILFVNFANNEKAKRAVLAFMMPSGFIGGAAAILIPTSSSMNYWVITLQYFIYHAALIAFALSILLSKEIKLNIKDYYTCLIFIFALMFFSIYINSIVDDGSHTVNFMYVVAPPQEGLPFLNKNHGWLVYILHYACLVLVSITACYCKPIIAALKEGSTKRKSAKAE